MERSRTVSHVRYLWHWAGDLNAPIRARTDGGATAAAASFDCIATGDRRPETNRMKRRVKDR